MKKYQNLTQTNKDSTFIEVGTFSGDTLRFTASTPKTNVGGVEVNFAKSSLTATRVHDVTSCVTECGVGTVVESMKLEFNLVSIESYDVLKAEIDRVMLEVKTSLLHGVLPPVYSDFTEA